MILGPGSPVTGLFDGVVLGGGCDVDPARYGRLVRDGSGVEVDAERDRTDFDLFERAWRDQAPILGICRGLQVVNVALGGTLLQDIPSEHPSEVVHRREDRDKTRRDHKVKVTPGTRLQAIAGETEILVNSRHHQAIEQTGRGLSISAVAPDGLVEGVESQTPWLLAVQWHPENLVDDPVSRRLFAEFARAVRERATVTSR